MAYQIPETVQLYSLRADLRCQVARLDHFTVYTDLPREGEQAPPHGALFAYYRVDEESRLRRVQLGMQAVKFSPTQLPSVIATHLLKS